MEYDWMFNMLKWTLIWVLIMWFVFEIYNND